LREVFYDRQKGVGYAQEWAYKRNPKYFDFENFGGDCTSFISQCIFAGAGVMNYTSVMGWFYNSSTSRSPSWSGVQFLYNFLTTNNDVGPFASEVDISKLEIGDIIQLGDKDDKYFHSLYITKINGAPSVDTIYVSTHSFDANLRALNTYFYSKARYLHIDGVRKY